MSQNISRRAVTQGVAWAAPAVALAVSAPAASASPVCDPTPIDLAFASRLCNGEPVTLELNLYQPLGALNGYATDAYINVKNLSDCSVSFTSENPLGIDIQIRNVNVVNDNGRSLTRAVTSWGSLSREGLNVANQPAGSVNWEVDWLINERTLAPDREADMAFGFGDGLAGLRGRWNNYLTITPRPFGLPAPSFEETGAPDTAACRAYYDQKMVEWINGGSIRWVARGPKTGTIALAPGETLDSRRIGNYSSVTGSNSTDGIW